MADLTSEIYLPTSSDVLRDQFLRDVRLAAIDAGITAPPVTPGTDWHILGTALGNLGLIGLQNIAIGQDNTNVLTATGEALQNIRKAYGIEAIEPIGSSGKVIITVTGSTTIANGTQGTLPNGKRARVVGTYVNPADNSEINVQAIDVGDDTNLAGGELFRFRVAPTNVAQDARVSSSTPLAGGSDGEDDERLRVRILNKLANVPGGGNWGQLRQVALDADGGIQDVFVYPALGGPGSIKVICIRKLDPENSSFTRACTAAQLDNVRQALHTEFPSTIEIVVGTVEDNNADFAWSFTLPDSALAGGNGTGWIDPTPWPQLESSDSGRVTISSVTSSTVVVVTAQTATAPVDSLNTIAWWSSVDRKFYITTIQDSSGSAGAWTLTLQTPLVDSNGDEPDIGDFICPAAKNIEGYGEQWVELFNTLGPCEQTEDEDRLPRAVRHPFTSVSMPCNWSDLLIKKLQDKYSEIYDADREYALLTSPTVPSTVDSSPGILTPRHFAIYPA